MGCQNRETHSFPTMYNTWLLCQNGSKQWFSPKQFEKCCRIWHFPSNLVKSLKLVVSAISLIFGYFLIVCHRYTWKYACSPFSTPFDNFHFQPTFGTNSCPYPGTVSWSYVYYPIKTLWYHHIITQLLSSCPINWLL